MEKREIYIFIIIVIIIALAMFGSLTNFAVKFLGESEINVINLSNFPSLFINQNGGFSSYLAYNFNAKNAVDFLKRSLFDESKYCAELTKPKGGNIKEEKIKLTETLQGSFGTVDADVHNGFYEGSVCIDIGSVDNCYSARDEMRFSSTASIETGLTYDPSDQWRDSIFIPLEREAISYYFIFESNLKTGNYITDASSSEPVKIQFLGYDLLIEGATSNTITVATRGTWLEAGDSREHNGKIVTLEHTNPDKAIVIVDGMREVINKGSSKIINGLKIEVEEVSDESGAEYDAALIRLADETGSTFKDGDGFIGEGNDPDWIWDIENLNTNNPTIGIIFDGDKIRPENVIYGGENFCLPNNYVCMEMNVEKTQEALSYRNYEVKDSSRTLYESSSDTDPSVSNAKVISLKSGSGNGFKIGDVHTDEIYLYSTGDSLKVYRKADGKTTLISTLTSDSSGVFNLREGKSETPVNIEWSTANDNGHIVLDNSVGNDVKIYIEADTNNEFSYLGHSDGATTTANDLLYGSLDISGYDEDTRTGSGIVIRDPKSRIGSDRVEFAVPGTADNFEVSVAIVKQTKPLFPSDVGCSFNSLNLVESRDVGSLNGENIIIVGDAELAKDYMNDEIIKYYEENKGIMILVNNGRNNALLIIGKDAYVIENLANNLGNLKEYQLSGDIYVVE